MVAQIRLSANRVRLRGLSPVETVLIFECVNRARLGRVLINESWVSGGTRMSVLEPTPVANQRI